MKRILITIMVCMIIIVCPVTMQAQEVNDTAGIREFVTTYQNVWNTHNPAEISKFFSKDADMVFGNSPAAQGRHSIEAWWQNYFDIQEPERHGWFDISFIKFLNAATAIIDIRSTTGIAEDNSTFRKARGTWLVNHTYGNWKICAMRGLPAIEDHVELVASIETAEHFRPQIRAFVSDYEYTFNKHDSKALSKFFREDANIIIREMPVIYGSEAINELWRTYFSRPRPYRAILIIDEIRSLSEDVVLVNISATGTSLKETENLVPVRQTRATWILLRENGKWLISALRILPGIYDQVIRN